MIYEYVSDNYIQDNLTTELYDTLYPPLHNISSVMGDIEGKLGRRSVLVMKSRLTLSTPGIMTLSGQLVESLRVKGGSLPQEEFLPQVSYEAYELFSGLRISDTEVVSSLDNISELLDFNTYGIRDIEIQTAVCSVYLDTFVLYHALLKSSSKLGVEGMTIQEVDRIIQNIRCISFKLESMEIPPYLYIRILRDLGRALAYVTSLDWLFNRTHVKNVRDARDRVNTSWKF